MKQLRTAYILLIPMICASLIWSGCTTPRSNTRNYEERTVIAYIPARQSAPDLAPNLAPGLTDQILGIVFDLAIKLGQHLINLEAEKYESETSATAEDEIVMKSGEPSSGGVFVFTRSINVPEKDKLRKGMATERELKEQMAQLGGLRTTTGNTISAADGSNFPTLSPLTPQEEQTNWLPAFIAVGTIFPSPRNNQTFEIKLLGYYYHALKAKNLNGRIPFTKWHETSSAFTFRMRGPDQDKDYASLRFDGKAIYAVTWDRKNAQHGGTTRFVTFPDPPKSDPIRIPDQRRFVLNGILIETSEFRKALEKLAERIGEFSYDDVKNLVKKD